MKKTGKCIVLDLTMLAVKLEQLVKRYIAENEKLEITCLAEKAKHKQLV